MANRGRPTKHQLTYAQKVWDNYNQYYPPKEYTKNELMTRKQELAFNRLHKQYTELAILAGIEPNKTFITILTKKALHDV